MDRIDATRSQNHRPARPNGASGPMRDTTDVSIGELLNQLTADATHLMQQEVALAKVEARESIQTLQKAAVAIGVAAVLALPGAMALTAFLVVVLAGVTNSWWIATLTVGVVLMGAAGLMIQRARSALSIRAWA